MLCVKPACQSVTDHWYDGIVLAAAVAARKTVDRRCMALHLKSLRVYEWTRVDVRALVSIIAMQNLRPDYT